MTRKFSFFANFEKVTSHEKCKKKVQASIFPQDMTRKIGDPLQVFVNHKISNIRTLTTLVLSEDLIF